MEQRTRIGDMEQGTETRMDGIDHHIVMWGESSTPYIHHHLVHYKDSFYNNK